jgi:hypothetical protein
LPIKIRIFFVLLSVCSLQQTALGQDCDRSCLENLVDTYLDAVLANEPAALSLARDLRFTENGQRLEIGDGLWNTLKAKGGFRIFIADVPAQQVVFMGTIAEDHRDPERQTPALLALRLRLEKGAISEIEQFVVRDTAAAARVEAMAPRPQFTRSVSNTEHMSRSALLETANQYFNGLQRNDGKGEYPFADTCHRRENGSDTTNLPVPAGQVRVDPASFSTYSAQWTCLEQFQSGLLYFVNRIRDRRFVAVDEERGLVFAFVFFDHSGGEFRKALTPSGQPVTGGPAQPWTWYIAELFQIDQGRLDQIEVFLHQVPYGMLSGWSDYQAGMSSALQDVTFKR